MGNLTGLSEESFGRKLLEWYDRNKRDLPWRESNDPYRIWISEIMLQQTRVDQARPYYLRFIERFPTVEALSGATQQEVLKAWEGLGYYSRARNLHHASKTVVEEFDGKLPDTREEITTLKGIGPYTASALLSIAFNKPCAVVDGNVIRTLSRYFGVEGDIRLNSTRNEIQELADGLIDQNRPGDFNQALMELGATVCSPINPECGKCPVRAGCVAFKTLRTETIPYKSPAKKKQHHQIGVGIIRNKRGEVLIALRPDDVMLGGLWEFPGGKQKMGEKIEETVVRELREELGVETRIIESLMKLDHSYSHFKITLHAFICEILEGSPKPGGSEEIRWVHVKDLEHYPFPKANRKLTEKLMNPEQYEDQNSI